MPREPGGEAMFDISIQQLLYRAVGWLIVVGVHGWALASVARLLRDPGPARDGRATPNPLPHLDALGYAAALVFRTGWIRPIRLELGEGWRGLACRALVGSGGLLATMAFALFVRLSRPILFGSLASAASLPLITFADTVIVISLRFVALNLVPLPPLALGHVWPPPKAGHEPRRARVAWLMRVVLVVALGTGVAQRVLQPVEAWLARLIAFG